MNEDMNVTFGEQTGTENMDKNVTENVNQQGHKTYTEEEFNKSLTSQVDKRVSEALKTARGKWEQELLKKQEEAEKNGMMTAKEGMDRTIENQKNEFEKEREEYIKDKLEFETTKELSKMNLPISFAKILCKDDIDSTNESIKIFNEEFTKAVKTAVEDRLKTAPPKISQLSKGNKDPFLLGFDKM